MVCIDEARFQKLLYKLIDNCVQKENQYVISFIEKFFSKQESFSFVDIGLGNGSNLELIKRNFPNVSIKGIDINPNLIKKNKGKFDVKYGSCLNIPYDNNSFDVVFCSHVIEHFGYPEIKKVLEELTRIVKPTGIIFLKSLYNGDSFYNDIDHVRPYYPATLNNYFGLEQQQSIPSEPLVMCDLYYVEYPPYYYFKTIKPELHEYLRILSWKYLRLPKSSKVHWGAVYKIKGEQKNNG